MKKELSSIEIHFLVKEFEELLDSKVSRIYQPDKKEIVFQFFKTGKGKIYLTIRIPNFIYISEEKKESKLMPYGFCMTLRKYLENNFLEEIKQIKSERIIDLLFNAKNKKYHLIIELFSKGNAILCNEDYSIIQAVEHQEWKDRIIKPKEAYRSPEHKCNFFEIRKNELKELIRNSKKDVVATLAVDLGLGGTFSEEVLSLSSINKNKKDLTEEELELIYDNLKKITNRKVDPVVIKKSGKIENVFPFSLGIFKDFEQEKIKSFSRGIELLPLELPVKTPNQKKIERINRIIEQQERMINEIGLAIEENTERAEKIYHNYALVKEVINDLNKIKEKHSWKEIKEKLKGHHVIKDVDEKEKKVLVKLG